MTKVPVSFFKIGRRWFSGKRINENYHKADFPHLFDEDGHPRGDDDHYGDDENDTDFNFQVERCRNVLL